MSHSSDSELLYSDDDGVGEETQLLYLIDTDEEDAGKERQLPVLIDNSNVDAAEKTKSLNLIDNGNVDAAEEIQLVDLIDSDDDHEERLYLIDSEEIPTKERELLNLIDSDVTDLSQEAEIIDLIDNNDDEARPVDINEDCVDDDGSIIALDRFLQTPPHIPRDLKPGTIACARKPPPLPAREKFKMQEGLKSMIAYEGDTVCFDVRAYGNFHTDWYKDGIHCASDICLTSEGAVSSDTFTISNVTFDDCGIYSVICKAMDEVEFSCANLFVATKRNRNTDILYYEGYVNDRIRKELQTEYAYERENLTIKIPYDKPCETYQIYRNNELLNENFVTIEFTEKYLNVQFTSVRVKDSGLYSLVFKSKDSVLCTTRRVYVMTKMDMPFSLDRRPRIIEELPRLVAVNDGENVHMTCRIERGYPATVEWLNDGIPLRLDSRMSIDECEDYTTLTIKYVRRPDYGRYTYVVKSGGEEVKTTCHLYVGDHLFTPGRLEVVKPLPNVIATIGSTCTLKCTVAQTEFNAYLNAYWFIGHFSFTNSTPKFYVTTDGIDFIVHIPCVEFAMGGEVRCYLRYTQGDYKNYVLAETTCLLTVAPPQVILDEAGANMVVRTKKYKMKSKIDSVSIKSLPEPEEDSHPHSDDDNLNNIDTPSTAQLLPSTSRNTRPTFWTPSRRTEEKEKKNKKNEKIRKPNTTKTLNENVVSRTRPGLQRRFLIRFNKAVRLFESNSRGNFELLQQTDPQPSTSTDPQPSTSRDFHQPTARTAFKDKMKVMKLIRPIFWRSTLEIPRLELVYCKLPEHQHYIYFTQEPIREDQRLHVLRANQMPGLQKYLSKDTVKDFGDEAGFIAISWTPFPTPSQKCYLVEELVSEKLVPNVVVHTHTNYLPMEVLEGRIVKLVIRPYMKKCTAAKEDLAVLFIRPIVAYREHKDRTLPEELRRGAIPKTAPLKLQLPQLKPRKKRN